MKAFEFSGSERILFTLCSQKITYLPQYRENRLLEALLPVHQNGALKMAAGFLSTEDKSSSTWQFAQFWVMVLISFGFLCLQSMELYAETSFLSLNHTRSLWYPIETQYMTATVFSCELGHFMSLTKALKISTTCTPHFAWI